MAEKDKNNTKKWNPNEGELESFASALSYNLSYYYTNSFVDQYQKDYYIQLSKLNINKTEIELPIEQRKNRYPREIYNLQKLENILEETTQKLKAMDESNKELEEEKLDLIQKQSLLKKFIDLQKLRKLATQYLIYKDINLLDSENNIYPLDYANTQDLFETYDIEELIETYRLENLEVLKKNLKKRAKEEGNKDPELVHQNALDTETEVKNLIADLPKNKTILSINNDPINIADIYVEDKLQSDPETIFNDAIEKINSEKEEVYIKNAKFELLTVLQSIKMEDEIKYQQIIEQNSSLLNRLFSNYRLFNNYTDKDLQFDTGYSRKTHKKKRDIESIHKDPHTKNQIITSIYGDKDKKIKGDEHTQYKLEQMRNIIKDIKETNWFNKTRKRVVGRGGRRSTRKRKKTIRKKRKNKKRTRRFR